MLVHHVYWSVEGEMMCPDYKQGNNCRKGRSLMSDFGSQVLIQSWKRGTQNIIYNKLITSKFYACIKNIREAYKFLKLSFSYNMNSSLFNLPQLVISPIKRVLKNNILSLNLAFTDIQHLPAKWIYNILSSLRRHLLHPKFLWRLIAILFLNNACAIILWVIFYC